MSVLNRFGYAVKSGFRELYSNYGWGDLAKDVAMPKAEAYSKAVKAGLISAKTLGKVASRAIPVYGYYSTAQDVWTFGKGFIKGWQAYGR
ncbi:MAG: hypothetical protein C0P72_008410 [Clostridia bacterium]|jgi:hypothetical protein